MSEYYIDANGIWKEDHQLSWSDLCDELNQLKEENEKLKLKMNMLYTLLKGWECDSV